MGVMRVKRVERDPPTFEHTLNRSVTSAAQGAEPLKGLTPYDTHHCGVADYRQQMIIHPKCMILRYITRETTMLKQIVSHTVLATTCKHIKHLFTETTQNNTANAAEEPDQHIERGKQTEAYTFRSG